MKFRLLWFKHASSQLSEFLFSPFPHSVSKVADTITNDFGLTIFFLPICGFSRAI